MARRPTISTCLVLALLTLSACSGDDDGTGADGSDGATAAADVDRPAGPAAEISGPLTGGDGINLASVATGPDLEDAGWVEEEYAAEGTATSYRSTGALPADGSYDLEADATADYRTRIVVRRPGDAADFNGTVVVEWLNVSGGLDANPDYGYTADELVRGGYAWVGVSAQHIGIEGGPVAVTVPGAEGLVGKGLTTLDPERYGSLHHPGDAFAYDIFTQVGRALREHRAVDALGGLEPQRLLAVGESQSAFTLTTYVNGIQPLTLAYDGFLIHSRGGAAAPLGEPDAGIDIAGTVGGEPTRIRTDLDTPVLVLETETDVLSILGYFPARQPDSERFRLWEVAGTAHADAYLLGPIAGVLDCPKPINSGPHHFVVKAALRSLDAWVRTGEAPPEAPRLEVHESSTPTFVRDADGNAVGGIRTPQLDVPVATLSGDPTTGSSVVCMLMGSTTPLEADRLRELYPTPEAYLDAYTEAADAAIEAGFVLEDDREALLADADPSAIPG